VSINYDLATLAFHTCLILHFPSVHFGAALSSPAFSVALETTTITNYSAFIPNQPDLSFLNRFSQNFVTRWHCNFIGTEKSVLPVFTAGCYVERGYATVSRLCVCLWGRYVFHTSWNTSKIISRPNSLRHLLTLTPTWAIWCNGNTPKLRWNKMGSGAQKTAISPKQWDRTKVTITD